MNKQSNTYIIVYSIILVVVAAVVLAFTSLSLAEKQQANVEIEKMSDILGSVGLYNPEAPAATENKEAFIKEQYQKYIVESFLVDAQGEKVNVPDPAAAAFSVLNNLKAEFAKPVDSRQLPVFISKNDQGVVNYILPVYGAGLWGPIWGYIAMNEDLNTIDGAVFGHKGETPGLGAEIATPPFENQFVGKTIFDGAQFVGIEVLKGAGSSKGNNHAVDAITGGTITSRAVQAMLMDCLKDFEPYILKQRAALAK